MANSDLIAIRLKLIGGKLVAEGLGLVSKETRKLGDTTSRTASRQSKATKVTSRLTAAYRSMGTTAKAGLGFLGVGGVFALQSAIHNTEELSKTTTGLTRNLGLQTNVASRWGAVAQAREIDSKSLTMSFTTLSRKMVEAGRSGGTLLTPFHLLGLSQEDAAKGAKNFQWGLLKVATALGEAGGGAKRQAAAQQLLGRGYQTILPLFSEGTKGLKEQLHWADKYGVTLSGNTNEALMEMVQAQRESKVAMLGLQVSLTKALMPAIEAGQDQLHEFIATLNDPKLTDEQKFARIGKQFQGIEDELIKLIDKAGPEVAEHAGRLGIALAGALWKGFINSDTIGKLAIGAWLFTKMGGLGIIGNLGATIGGKLAKSLGWKFLETVTPYFAAEAGVEGMGSALGSQMGGLKTLFSTKGKILGTAMGAAAAGALVAEIVFAVEKQKEHKLFDLFDLADPQGTDATTTEDKVQQLTQEGYTGVHLGFPNPNNITATDPHGHKVRISKHGKKWSEHNIGGGGKGRKRPKATKGDPRTSFSLGGGGGAQTVNLMLPDGSTLATAVLRAGEQEAALR